VPSLKLTTNAFAAKEIVRLVKWSVSVFAIRPPSCNCHSAAMARFERRSRSPWIAAVAAIPSAVFAGRADVAEREANPNNWLTESRTVAMRLKRPRVLIP